MQVSRHFSQWRSKSRLDEVYATGIERNEIGVSLPLY